jgi:hypothetical protein
MRPSAHRGSPRSRSSATGIVPGTDILAANLDTAVPMEHLGSTIASLGQLAQSQSTIGQILIRSHDHPLQPMHGNSTTCPAATTVLRGEIRMTVRRRS